MHHTSFSEPDFQRSLAEDPFPFCADCHAPRRRDLGDVVAAELGVDCVSCHTNAAAHERDALAGTPRTSVMTTAPCASCHELPNPLAATMLQTTNTEHEASGYPGVTCVDCHMKPRASGAHDHEMSVMRNAPLLSSALAYEVRRANGNVVVALRSKGVGHRFPTGDLFRALVVHCWIEAPDGRIAAETTTSLHRDWDAVRRVPGAREAADTRLTASPIEIVLTDPGVPASRLHIEVDYVRGATARGDRFTMYSSLRIADWTTPAGANAGR